MADDARDAAQDMVGDIRSWIRDKGASAGGIGVSDTKPEADIEVVHDGFHHKITVVSKKE